MNQTARWADTLPCTWKRYAAPAFAALAALLCSVTFATTFTVTTVNDSGAGSLRQAIIDANADATATSVAPHLIQFGIAAAGVQTIAPTSQFPLIVRPVIINGFTQSGSSANTLAVGNDSVHLIELNGTNANITNACFYFSPGSAGSILRGMVINRCPGSAITINTGNVALEGNFIGINAAGNASLGGGSISNGAGIGFEPGVVVIGGALPAQRNVISGSGTAIIANAFNGIVITGNYIGTNAAGTATLGGQGIVIGTVGGATLGAFTIGGITATPGTGAGNVISGSTGTGIQVTAQSNTPIGVGAIQGNLIGLAAGGAAAVGNASIGISLDDNGFGSGGPAKLAAVTIGGVAGARNVISGNGGPGIRTVANTVIIQSNYVGTDISGTTALPNFSGISVTGGNSINGIFGGTQTVGGVGLGNVVSGNTGVGITVALTTATVRGNLVGTRADGVTPLGNGDFGILVDSGSAAIGGTTVGQGNVITANGTEGIRVRIGAPAIHNASSASILGNSIYANGPGVGPGGLGINLFANDFVTANDLGDADTGPSDLQNYPVIASATTAGNVQGSLNSTANTTYRVEFFASTACDPSGFGEGQTFVGFQSLLTDGFGNAAFNVSLPALPVGQAIVTATATDPAGNTSEFSQCVSAAGVALPTLSVNNVSANEGNAGTTAFTFTVTLSAASASTVTVNYATADGTATAGSDYTATSGTLTFNPGVLTQPITVNVSGDTTVEANETFFVNLSTPVNATIATGQGTGTILNDDAAPFVAASAIPTLDDWAMVALALMLAATAMHAARRRRR